MLLLCSTSLIFLTTVFCSSLPSQDAHDLWVQYCWLRPRCCCGGWRQQQQQQQQHLCGWPSHGERGPEDQLQHQAADRAGEGVPLQQVPDAGQAGGGGRRPAAERDAGESLVSEQTHEAEEIAERRAALRPAGGALTRRDSGHLPLSARTRLAGKTPGPDLLSATLPADVLLPVCGRFNQASPLFAYRDGCLSQEAQCQVSSCKNGSKQFVSLPRLQTGALI